MRTKFIIAVSILVSAFACSDENSLTQQGLASSQLKIKTGTICGWCSMNDTLAISGNTIRYVNYTNCDNSKPAVENKGELSNKELETLLSKLDLKELTRLDMNTCNVCADGCDDWISFDNGEITHYIRFSRADPKLNKIQAFIDELNALRSKYSSKE